MNVESVTKAWKGAVLMLWRPLSPEPIRRSAAFMFDLPGGGFAWVEPSYRDPFGPASPALHARPRAKLRFLNAASPDFGFWFEDEETGERGMVYPWRPEDLPAVPELEALTDDLEKAGVELGAERERVRPAVSVGPEA